MNQTQAKLNSLLMIQTNTYNDQVIRPYQTSADLSAIAKMQEATQHGEVITAASLAGVAGSILRPQAQAIANVQMYNGWDQRRLRFMLTVSFPIGMGGAIHEVVTGYTDHYGTTADGQGIDPEMRLFFNNTVTLNSTVVERPGIGAFNQMRVAEASHLLMPPPGLSNGSAIDTHTMRPEDVMNVISTQMITDGTRLDLRSNFAMGPVKKSYRSNGLAPDYMARTLRAVDSATSVDSSMEHNTMYQEARGLLKEPMLLQDMFIQCITHKTRFKECGWITYRELCACFPETEHVRTMVMPGSTQQAQSMTPGRGQSEYWHVPTNETVVATILSQGVPAIMADLMLTKMTFIATNDTLNGQPEIQIRGFHGFTEGMDMTPYVQRFMQRFLTEMFADITHNNMFQVYMAVDCNLLGDTLVKISLNGAPAIDYVTPSFCDALLSPLLTTDTQSFHTLAHDIDVINNNLSTYRRNDAATSGMFGMSNVAPNFNFGAGFDTMSPSNHPATQQGVAANVGSSIISSI